MICPTSPSWGSSTPTWDCRCRIFARASGSFSSWRRRRGERPGEVIIQPRRPSHEVFVFAQGHDVKGFYDRELERRRELGYPTFGRLVIGLITGADESRGRK